MSGEPTPGIARMPVSAPVPPADPVERYIPLLFRGADGRPRWITWEDAKGPDDLLAVCRINYSPDIITARTDAPFKTMKEMLEWAKANPAKVNAWLGK